MTDKKSDELYEIPVGATTKDLPPGVLYKVSVLEIKRISIDLFLWFLNFHSLTFYDFLGEGNLQVCSGRQ